MADILGAATKVIAVFTILLAAVYFLFTPSLQPLKPNPDAPTFADVQAELRARAAENPESFNDPYANMTSEEMREAMEAQREQMELRMQQYRERTQE